MKKAIFLDRDGVINRVILNGGEPFSPRRFREFEFLDGIKEVLEKFKEVGFINIIITNQPDIARGLIEWEISEKMHKVIRENLPIDDIFVCPHDDIDQCPCRKPKPGMLLEAAKKWDIDLKSSFLIGDQWKDIGAGKNAGCATILISYPYNKKVNPDFRVNNLHSAAEVILRSERRE